jgi:hypothetical protein
MKRTMSIIVLLLASKGLTHHIRVGLELNAEF